MQIEFNQLNKPLPHEIHDSDSEAHFSGATNPSNPNNPTNAINPIVGILPLVHLKHFLFGNSLISMPFFDTGGILTDNDETEKALLSEAIKLGQILKVHNIELRHIDPIASLNQHHIQDEKAESSAPFRRRRIEISQFHLETEKNKKSIKSCLVAPADDTGVGGNHRTVVRQC